MDVNKLKWGDIQKEISAFLEKKFPEIGFKGSNLTYMQQFYRRYRTFPNKFEMAENLSWSAIVELIKGKVDNNERFFYQKKAIEETWSSRKLREEINNDSYDEFIRIIEVCNYQYKIGSVHIKNYKSLVDVKIDNPSKFLVFAGANASGKSSIFESIEFLMHSAMTTRNMVFGIFGGIGQVVNFNAQDTKNDVLNVAIDFSFGNEEQKSKTKFEITYDIKNNRLIKSFTDIEKLDERIVDSFSRIFIDNNKRASDKIKIYDKLWFDASNLSNVLETILKNDKKKKEIIEWLQLIIPEVESVTIDKDFAGKNELRIIETSFPNKFITGNLISEGTYNIIALLAAFYQTDKPMFLCIEEPEIGLNPGILEALVPFFRDMTNRYHHHIWITTHSPMLVAQLKEIELIMVNKKEGKTKIKQFKEGDFYDMKPDDAWMSNMIGGLPW